MFISKIDQILIEKYLDKTLTDTEQATFNQRLNDADFAAEVKRYERAIKAVHAFGDSQLKAMLQEEEAKLQAQGLEPTPSRENPDFVPQQYEKDFQPKTAQKFLIRNWIGIAAGFLILISVGYWFLNQQTSLTLKGNDALFETYFKPYKNFEKPNVRDETTKTDLEKAYSLYDNGDYKQALVYFEKITPPQYLDDSGLFFEANAYLATNQTEKAIPILEKLTIDATSKWQQPAEWYLALALSKTQTDQATVLFEKIKGNPKHLYQKQAETILKR